MEHSPDQSSDEIYSGGFGFWCNNFPVAKEYIHDGGFKKGVPLLEDVVVIEGATHFINQEKAGEISSLIYDFITKL